MRKYLVRMKKKSTYAIVLQIPVYTCENKYLARYFQRAMMSQLPLNILSSVLKSPLLHPPSPLLTIKASLYCGCVSKVLNKPMLRTCFKFYFYSFISFLGSPNHGGENYFILGLSKDIMSLSFPSAIFPTTFLSFSSPDTIGTAILMSLLIMGEQYYNMGTVLKCSNT